MAETKKASRTSTAKTETKPKTKVSAAKTAAPAKTGTVKKPAPAKRPAAAKPAVKATPKAAAKPRGAKAKTPAAVAPEQRRNYVEVAAYYIAARRGFAPGDPLQDWIQAEAEVDRLLGEGLLGGLEG